MENYYSLRHLGINAYAFPMKQVLNIISKFLKNNVPILGGDVYCLNKGIITNSYDNWYCNLETGESQKHFAERSSYIAKQYIKNYPENNKIENIFSIITEANILEYIECLEKISSSASIIAQKNILDEKTTFFLYNLVYLLMATIVIV